MNREAVRHRYMLASWLLALLGLVVVLAAIWLPHPIRWTLTAGVCAVLALGCWGMADSEPTR